MASSNTAQSPSCVGSDRNTRTKSIDDQSVRSGEQAEVKSAPICRQLCQGCQSQGAILALKTNKAGLVCAGSAAYEKQQGSKDQESGERVYCSCDLLGVPSYRQRNSTGVVCARRRRTNYRRSLSLPSSSKSLYDIVVSEDLLCVGHICDASLPGQIKSENGTGRQCHSVKQSLSYQDRDLVKMEIELELAKNMTDNLKALHSNGTSVEPKQHCEHVGGGDSVATGDELMPKGDTAGVGHNCGVSTQEGGSGGSSPISGTSEWSLELTPNIVCDEMQNKKRLGRSHSWTFSTNFMDLDSDSSMSQDSIFDFENGTLRNKPKPLWTKRQNNSAVGGDYGNGVTRTRRRCRNMHATLSLNEQEIQALEEHLEQNMYVPVQLLIGSRGSRRRPPNEIARPLFILAEIVTDECCVCLTSKMVRQRSCCDAFICDSCLKSYLTTMVNQRLVTMQCPNYACKKFLSREEIAYHLDHTTREKFYRFILEANCEPHMKTCPQCNFLTTVDKELLAKKFLPPIEARICCEQCDLRWCFPCHAPWHEGLTCKEFWKGDRLLKEWAKERQLGIANAHRCPKCRVFIQRSSGCDHMTCSRCGTEFCYQCGGRFRGIRYFGNHYSRYSIFGCKYRFKPEDPVERKVIRGAIFGCQLLATPFCVGLAAAAGCLIVPIGLVAVPAVYGGLKLNRYLIRRRYRRKQEKIAREDRELGGCKVLAAPLCLGLAVGAGSLILTVGAIALPIYGGYKLHKRLTHQPQPSRRLHYTQPFHGGFDPMDLEGYALDPIDLIPREATII